MTHDLEESMKSAEWIAAGDERVEKPARVDIDGAEFSPGEAWERVDVGRYMPRRIRGSLRGRELG
jgi:hypothetical protein